MLIETILVLALLIFIFGYVLMSLFQNTNEIPEIQNVPKNETTTPINFTEIFSVIGYIIAVIIFIIIIILTVKHIYKYITLRNIYKNIELINAQYILQLQDLSKFINFKKNKDFLSASFTQLQESLYSTHNLLLNNKLSFFKIKKFDNEMLNIQSNINKNKEEMDTLKKRINWLHE